MTKLQRLENELATHKENLLITRFEDEKQAIERSIDYLNYLIKKENAK